MRRTLRTQCADARELQSLLDSGSLSEWGELLRYLADRGWSLTRQGVDYLGVKTTADRWRVRLNQPLCGRPAPEVHRRKRNPDCKWHVYALLAVSAEHAMAAYVGSTSDLTARLAAHAKDEVRVRTRRVRTLRAAMNLFVWANAAGASIVVIVLGEYESAKVAILHEGMWTERLSREGLETPGVDRWLAARRKLKHIGLNQVEALAFPTRETIRDAKLLSFSAKCS